MSKFYLKYNDNYMFRLSFLSHLQFVTLGYLNIQLYVEILYTIKSCVSTVKLYKCLNLYTSLQQMNVLVYCMTEICSSNFDILLTVHLSIVLVINQLNAQNIVL